MGLIIAFDADNTLWDTDSVFRQAQLAMLATLAEAGLVKDSIYNLEMLRLIDGELGKQLGTFEYDFRLLPAAILDYYSRSISPEESVNKTLASFYLGERKDIDIIGKAFTKFENKLKAIPEFYSDTASTLSCLRDLKNDRAPIVTFLFSEGDPLRLERIIKAHKVRESKYFNQIIIGVKSKHSFEKVKSTGFSYLQKEIHSNTGKIQSIMVGDNLKRDILFANQAGFITVYKPSTYKGVERFREPDEKPAYIINKLGTLLEIINGLGVQINDCIQVSEILR